ncbi:MAG: OmpA family protein [Paracoccaceae bacterium]
MTKAYCAIAALVSGLLAGPAAALDLTMPGPVAAQESRQEPAATYILPTGPITDGQLPHRRLEGALDQRAWVLDARGVSSLELLQPLRAELVAQGFQIIFECETHGCGGFDFRFTVDVMPEPAMHVDLGDFRFLSAEKGDEAVTLLVSRSPAFGFVQLTRLGALPLPPPAPLNTDLPELPIATEPAAPPEGPTTPVVAPEPPQVAGDLAATLRAQGSVVLEDLVFASGAAALEPGDYPSLLSLAAWLAESPENSVLLVGHTDSSGALKANVDLSKRRAEGVRQALLALPGVKAGQVRAEGVGPLAPRASNLTEEGRQKNRRVEAVMASGQ